MIGCGPPSGVSSRPYIPPGASVSSGGSPWCPPPSVSTSASSPPDYIGCLSQMSNAFLPASDEPASSATPSGTIPTSVSGASQPPMHPMGSGPPSGMSRQHSDHGSGGASLPPTPVGSQLSGSQICTPLDGQLLHPRTPSDAANGPASACTPGGPHLPSTPLDGSSSACSSASQKSPSMSANVIKRRESSSCGGSVPPQDGGTGLSSNDALPDVQLCGVAGDVGSAPGDGSGSRPGSGATDNTGIDPADQEALDVSFSCFFFLNYYY
jgi:hypothetical protein